MLNVMLNRLKQWLASHISTEMLGKEPVVVARIEMFAGGGMEVNMVPQFQMSLSQLAGVVNFMKIACGLNLAEVEEVERKALSKSRSNVLDGPWIH